MRIVNILIIIIALLVPRFDAVSDGFNYESFYEEGHPKFNDTMEKAMAFKQRYNRSVCINEIIEGSHVLIISGDDMVDNLSVIFQKISCRDFDDVLRVAKACLPFDVIEKYYDKKEAFIVTRIKGKPIPETHYLYLWEMNDKGKQMLADGTLQGSELIVAQIACYDEGYLLDVFARYPDWTITDVRTLGTHVRVDWDIDWDKVA